MMISRSCSWCHEMNSATERYCRSCHHEAHVCRLDCGCRRCADRRAATDTPTALAEVIAGAIATIGPRAGESETPADGPATTEGEPIMPKKNKHASDPAPVTREVVRTPVSAKLAGLVRELDAALMAEFGPVWFAYSILGGDGLVAASNARDGVVPPVVAAGTGAGGDTSSDREEGRRDE